jgi:hypothetical protein
VNCTIISVTVSIRRKWRNIKLIGLDQSSIISGYSIFEDEKLKKFGIIDTGKSGADFNARMSKINEDFTKLFKAEKPDYVAIEAVQMQGGNKHAFMVLSNVQGMLFSILISLDIPFVVVESSKWRAHNNLPLYENKKRLKREQLKEKAVEIVADKYHVKASKDESESILIGQWLSDMVAADVINL